MTEGSPKYLRQTPSGRIYAYSTELAKRSDMVPYFPKPVVNVAVQTPVLPPDLAPKVEPPDTCGKGAGRRGGKDKTKDDPKE